MKKNCMSCTEKLACVFRILTGAAIFMGGYVFLSEVESIFSLAGTQWILIAILFSMLAINVSVRGGGCALIGRPKGCDCDNGKCDE